MTVPMNPRLMRLGATTPDPPRHEAPPANADEEWVMTWLAKLIGRRRRGLSLETDMIDDLGMDSLDRVEMSIKIEMLIGIQIKDDDIFGVRTIGDLVAMLDRLIPREVA